MRSFAQELDWLPSYEVQRTFGVNAIAGHLEGADPNVSRAHISLCISDEELGGTDLRGIMFTMADAVRMIAAELFPCWERA